MPDIAVSEAMTRFGTIVRVQSARVNRPARPDHHFFQVSAIFLDSPTVSWLAQSLSPGFRNAILEQHMEFRDIRGSAIVRAT